jgi:hypothetical protein
MVAHGKCRMMEMEINRTPQSRGSLGGDKKAGIVYYGPTWARVQIPNYRAPKNIPTYSFALRNTTLNPVQQTGSTIARLGLLLG